VEIEQISWHPTVRIREYGPIGLSAQHWITDVLQVNVVFTSRLLLPGHGTELQSPACSPNVCKMLTQKGFVLSLPEVNRPGVVHVQADYFIGKLNSFLVQSIWLMVL